MDLATERALQLLTMSVDELLVMAKALEVPPPLLLAPAGSGERVEVLPGIDAGAHEVLAWLDGTAPAPASVTDEGADARAELRLLRDHYALVEEWSARTRAAAISEARTGGQRQAWRDAARRHAQAAEHAVARIALLRKAMRASSVACPPLPPALIHLDLLPSDDTLTEGNLRHDVGVLLGMLRHVRRRYWHLQAEAMARLGCPNRPRLYEQYGRPALAGAADGPVMSQKIAERVEKLLHMRQDNGRPYCGLLLYAFLTGTAVGAQNVMFSDIGTGTFDDDGTNMPTMLIAACCQAAINQGMLEAA
ncbi:hypothetical protein [Nonomuraea sp. KM90]|uniref:hypothetical protein n=1 Tax=Nonomuraea sp. KM90 TaxID=3457428 RepID=UPI003FCDCB15